MQCYQVLGDEYLSDLGEPISKRLQDTIPHILRTANRAVEDGNTCTIENSRWMVARGPRTEERYLTASLIPLMEAEGNAAGILLLAHETTPRVLQERRARTLMDLATHLAEARRLRPRLPTRQLRAARQPLGYAVRIALSVRT